MSETINAEQDRQVGPPTAEVVDEQQLAGQLVEHARAEGLRHERARQHVGYEPHERAGAGNWRNGGRTKTVLTDVGPVELEVPRDRASTFEPRIVRKRQRRLSGVDDMVVSLTAKGLTTGEVQAHLGEVYGAEVSRQTISAITDRVLEGLAEWQSRPLDPAWFLLVVANGSEGRRSHVAVGDQPPHRVEVVLGDGVEERGCVLGHPDHDRSGAAAGAPPVFDPPGCPDEWLLAAGGGEFDVLGGTVTDLLRLDCSVQSAAKSGVDATQPPGREGLDAPTADVQEAAQGLTGRVGVGAELAHGRVQLVEVMVAQVDQAQVADAGLDVQLPSPRDPGGPLRPGRPTSAARRARQLHGERVGPQPAGGGGYVVITCDS